MATCAWCGKSTFVLNDPEQLYCNVCREMFLQDEMELELKELLKANTLKETKQHENIRAK